MVGTLFQMMTSGNYNNVVPVAHVMEPADNTIIEHRFVTHAVTVTKERISPLLVIGYHPSTDRHHQQAVALVLGLSNHRLPQ